MDSTDIVYVRTQTMKLYGGEISCIQHSVVRKQELVANLCIRTHSKLLTVVLYGGWCALQKIAQRNGSGESTKLDDS